MTGGLKKEVLWPSKRKWKRFLTVVLFVISPIAWVYRVYEGYKIGVAVESLLDVQFPGTRMGVGRSVGEGGAYSIWNDVTNSHGGQAALVPQYTFEYKSVGPASSSCKNELSTVDRLVPADTFFVRNRANIEAGNLHLDVYFDKVREGGAPILVHLHGGGWSKGDKAFLQVNYHGGFPHFVLEQGFIIVSVSYRLSCMGVAGKDMVGDVLDAVEYIKRHAQGWGGDGSNIVMWGTSAGGHLALMSASRGHDSIKGVVSFYGVNELRHDEVVTRLAHKPWFDQFHGSMFLEATRKICTVNPFPELDSCFHDISPIAQIDENMPPVLVIHGYHDQLVLIDQAHWLGEKLASHGVPHAIVAVQGGHDCDCAVSSNCGQLSLYAADRFFRHLGLV